MTPQPSVQALKTIHHLTIQAFAAQDHRALCFIVLNETAQLVPYDRAILWNFEGHVPKILGVSGHASVNPNSRLAMHWKKLVRNIKTPKNPQIITEASLLKCQKDWREYAREQEMAQVFWLPLPFKNSKALGLWIERWHGKGWQKQDIELLSTIGHSYSLALKRFSSRFSKKSLLRKASKILLPLFLLLTFLIKVPLRVVAPCEIVPEDPVLVTAPLEGIISEVTVTPGQEVTTETTLFEYDKRVPLQNLKVAQKQVQIIQSELNRALTRGITDQDALAEMAILELKLQKEKLVLEISEYYAGMLSVTSPVSGVAIFDNPEDWRGKPVAIGERVMIIGDPDHTKVRIWVPEDDNIILNTDIPIKIFLNINPERSRLAALEYVAAISGVSEKRIRGFEAEARWLEPQREIKMGLKGTAVLYGDDVILFYYLFRKPWAFLRRITGF